MAKYFHFLIWQCYQQQSPRGVLLKRYSWKFRKIQRKTPVPKSLSKQSCRPEALFYGTPLMAVSVLCLQILNQGN